MSTKRALCLAGCTLLRVTKCWPFTLSRRRGIGYFSASTYQIFGTFPWNIRAFICHDYHFGHPDRAPPFSRRRSLSTTPNALSSTTGFSLVALDLAFPTCFFDSQAAWGVKINKLVECNRFPVQFFDAQPIWSWYVHAATLAPWIRVIKFTARPTTSR